MMFLWSLWILSSAMLVGADFGPFIRDPAFDAGSYGKYPVENYVSTDLVSPRLNVLSSSTECDDSLYTVLGIRGGAVEGSYVNILDATGSLVYMTTGYQRIYNVMIQDYLGEPFLTFWGGDDQVRGHGEGYYYMLDSQYQERYKLDAHVDQFHGDLHDFRITENGTYIVTLYSVTVVDFSLWHEGMRGYVWDGVIQEIDIATGEVIFQWRATDFYTLADSFRKPPPQDGTEENPFDWFHLNSVDKDDKGNYLISARYVNCLTYISGQTGEVLWVLGGKKNMFQDLSAGKAINMMGQHDARWTDDYTSITVLDNGGNDEWYEREQTRGINIKVDQEKRTAELITEFINPTQIRVASQGSVQALPNGNFFVGYGKVGAWTEFSSNGTVLCDVHIGPESDFGKALVESYRTYKYAWHGYPPWPPALQVLDDGVEVTFFVSWNGATDIVTWVLQGADHPEAEGDEWKDLEHVPKTGFETDFRVDKMYPRYLRATAKDANNKNMGTSHIADTVDEVIWGYRPVSPSRDRRMGIILFAAALLLCGVIVAWRELKASVPWHRQLLEKESEGSKQRGIDIVKKIILYPVIILRRLPLVIFEWRTLRKGFRKVSLG